MESNKCLCIGTFFSLIVEGIPNSGGKRKGKYANYAIMEKLIKTVSPEFEWGKDSNKSAITSKFKNCETYGDTTPLSDTICLDKFDELVREDYKTALERMADFAKKYVSQDKKDWLASALVELVNKDDLAGKNAFFALENGTSIKTKDLVKNVRYIEPLLLGIWHYTVMNCRDNKVGENAISSWYEEKDDKHETAKFIGNIGKNPKFQVKVEFMDIIPKEEEISDAAYQEKILGDDSMEEKSAGNGVTNNYFDNATLQFANIINNIGHLDHLD